MEENIHPAVGIKESVVLQIALDFLAQCGKIEFCKSVNYLLDSNFEPADIEWEK